MDISFFYSSLIFPNFFLFGFSFLEKKIQTKWAFYVMADQWIIGSSWIWTSVDILPTNLQSVPINRSGIDPGRINSRFIDNPWSTSFRSTPTPRGSRIPAASLKERCPEPLDDGGIFAWPPSSSYYAHSMSSFLKLSIYMLIVWTVFWNCQYNGMIWLDPKAFSIFYVMIFHFWFMI